jgi:hypothetical protein
MQITKSNALLDEEADNRQPQRAPLSVVPPPPAEHGRLIGALVRVKGTLDAGESLWTPVIMLAAGYAITIPVFLIMWGLAIAAYYLAGGK